ncbi:DUF4292 domain-containing protein [Mucilaginibacter auburnensis]|uniref:Uncharacterized protein DUF4292 n=1 Tax=Mucilaginibacter auburnensis TaxID=1457233 RepID=A0A2H9VSS9_9SPHI|nr:DUF4292 domain-containing protein [Mucilaginibacter auburnensis]PJJ83883.1 uncharacterized protein DUF4292 [Mucilaginibacter auburnensis]
MRKNIANKIAVAFLVVLVVTGCKTKKALTAAPAATTPVVVDNSKANTIAAIKDRQLNFKTFSGKANAQLNIDNDNKNVNMNIRIDHGKQIWVSISVTVLATFEVARAVITPDSIKIVNKLQGVYIKKPFSYVHNYAGKQVNFATVEALLTGNAIPEFLSTNADLKQANGNVSLSGSMQELLYTLVFNPDLKVRQLDLSNSAQQQSLQVTNNSFVLVDSRTLPSQIAINSNVKGKKININLEYSKVELDRALETPFNIPESYTPAN